MNVPPSLPRGWGCVEQCGANQSRDGDGVFWAVGAGRSYTPRGLLVKAWCSLQKPARAERKKGKGALGLLKPIAELGEEKCCADNCTVVNTPGAPTLRGRGCRGCQARRSSGADHAFRASQSDIEKMNIWHTNASLPMGPGEAARARARGTKSQSSWVLVLPLPLIHCETLSKSLNLFVPQFPSLKYLK